MKHPARVIHTVIFDLDGTLSDSAILTMAAMEVVAPQLGLVIPTVDAVRKTTGIANPEFYFRLFPGHARETVLRLAVMVEEEELRILPTVASRLLFDGCRELLGILATRGLRLVIASTGDNDHVYSIIEATGIKVFFESIYCGRPDKKEMLAEISGGNGSGCLMIGDMAKDYEAAAANGIPSVGALYGYCVRATSRFDYYIDTPLDLLGIIDSLAGPGAAER